MTTKDYKNTFSSFNTAEFGEYSADLFKNGNRYRKPTAYPGGTHPSVLFTKNTVDKVRENLTAEENKYAYAKYIELSETEWDGKFKPLTDEDTYKCNYEGASVAILEAKAFRYAMTGETKYAKEAVSGIKNAIRTIDVRHNVSDWCRRYGHLMYIAACVYDWCYDVLTEEDKKDFIAGCVNILSPEFEVCLREYEGNKLPVAQGAIVGHGSEDQIFVDYLAFAIAVFNEAPEIYELVGGRLLNDYVAAQNFFMQSGSHWEGSLYGLCRMTSVLVSNILFNKMTDGYFTPFTPSMEEVVTNSVYYIRPDGLVYRIGDLNQNRTKKEGSQIIWMWENCFYAGNFYKNPYLKSLGYKNLKEFNSFMNSVAGLSVIQFLCINDPEVPHEYSGDVPLISRSYFPETNIFAKSAHGDKDAFGIFMTMPEIGAQSHAHLECGSFHIYYKGMLVTDSGSTRGGNGHRPGYAVQTISSNSILVYNPAIRNFVYPFREKMIYSGGQSVRKSCYFYDTLENVILRFRNIRQCKTLGVATLEKDGGFRYAYMAGDMTEAYDDETVNEVCRYMIAFATDDKKCPFAFMTFDRIGAKNKSFHKSALLHMQEEPEIEGDFAILTDKKNGNVGKLTLQTVGEAAEFTVIGGEGKEWWIPGVDENGNYSLEAGYNLPIEEKLVEDSIAEYGWGRIEISPKNHKKTNRILSVMYVTDSDNTDACVKAKEIKAKTLSGAEIFGKAVLFPKSEKFYKGEESFNLSGCSECHICGLWSGKWELVGDGGDSFTFDIIPGTNFVTFKVKDKNYTLKPIRLDEDLEELTEIGEKTGK